MHLETKIATEDLARRVASSAAAGGSEAKSTNACTRPMRDAARMHHNTGRRTLDVPIS